LRINAWAARRGWRPPRPRPLSPPPGSRAPPRSGLRPQPSRPSSRTGGSSHSLSRWRPHQSNHLLPYRLEYYYNYSFFCVSAVLRTYQPHLCWEGTFLRARQTEHPVNSSSGTLRLRSDFPCAIALFLCAKPRRSHSPPSGWYLRSPPARPCLPRTKRALCFPQS
jgi:hypothetical protein